MNEPGVMQVAAADLLIERSQRGDLEAFDRLVAEHADAIYHVTYRITGNPHDAQDAAQEAFVKAFRGLRHYRGDASFQTWLYRIATNAALDLVRRRPHARSAPLEEAADMVTDSAEVNLERQEIHRRVQDALETLSPEHRSLVVLRDLRGFSYEEIAHILRIPVGTVRSRLSRAREALRPQLKDLAPTVAPGEGES